MRSLRVLDGAVCILDSVAGVEAQTEKVYAQAFGYNIPRLIYVNKLDRDGASFARTVQEVGAKLAVWPAICGIPWWDSNGALKGVGDVINLRGLGYKAGDDGKHVRLSGLEQLEIEDPKLARELKKARTALVELLSEYDEQMVENFLEKDENHLAITPQDIRESLRRCVLQSPQRAVPVFAGASFRNIGVQPLLDAVVDLLPSHLERPDPEISVGSGSVQGTLKGFLDGRLMLSQTDAATFNKKLSKDKKSTALRSIDACALAFKVVTDPRRGVLVYVRVYSGTIPRNALLWNTNLQVAERAQRLMRMYANEAVDVEEIQAGHIGVIPGLKHARTGDSLIVSPGATPKNPPPFPASQLQLRPIDVPPPVFFVSVEPDSLSEERQVKESLEMLLREDPSLSVRVDDETGQTHLAGMGELHLEIARDRLVQDLKAKARIGSVEIGYREAVTERSGQVTETYAREFGGKTSEAGCTAVVSPASDQASSTGVEHSMFLPDDNVLVINTPNLDASGIPTNPEEAPLPPALGLGVILQSLQNGVLAALSRGPAYGYPLHSSLVQITFDVAHHIFPNTTPAALSSAARWAVHKALQKSTTMRENAMMEPVMRVAISVDEGSLGSVAQDISSARGGTVLSLDASALMDGSDQDMVAEEGATTVDANRIYVPPDPFGASIAPEQIASTSSTARTIIARVPLKEMVGYLKHLRSLTAGRGSFTMTVDRFEKMGSQRVKAALGALRGNAY